jgi:hypothetical protein
MRTIVKKSRQYANLFCPPRDKDDRKIDEKRRLEGFAYLYIMAWTTSQIVGFLVLFIIFLFSDYNYFMQNEDCCNATSYLNDNNNFPNTDCGMKSCLLYDHVFDGDIDLIQARPREPQHGHYSYIFEYNDSQYCCNLSENNDQCCSKLSFGSSCGAVMWVCGFSAVCSMVMVQVILSGFYSFSSRNKSWLVILSTLLAVLLRVILFFFIFYIFFGFMFSFIFFWVPMMYCDNQYAFAWWKFGYWYMKFFFQKTNDVWTKGITQWDYHMDMDAMVGCHSVYAFGVDLLFSSLYVWLNRIKKGYYLDLTFFDL